MRVAAGQIPYRDFSLPQGPVAPLLGGLFFSAFAPPLAWALLSGLLNVAMTALAFFTVTQVTANFFAGGVAALATAMAFLPPFGSFYNDHLAYVLVALAFSLFFFSPAGKNRAWLSGLLFALAFHTKQTVGLAGVASFALSYLLNGEAAHFRNLFRPLLWFLFFLIAGLLLIGVTGGGVNYWWDAVWLPITYAQNSADKSGWRLLLFLVFPWGITPSQLIGDFPQHWGRLALFPLQLLFWFWLWSWPQSPKKKGAVIFFCFSTLWGGALLGRASSHLFLGTGVVLGLVVNELRRKHSLRLSHVAAAVMMAVCSLQLIQSSLARRHEAPTEARALAAALRQLPPQTIYALGETALRVASLAGISPKQLNVYDDMAVTVPATYGGLIRWQTRFRERLETHPPDWILQDKGWLAYPAIGSRLARHLNENFAEVCRLHSLKLLVRRNLPLDRLPSECQKPSPIRVSSLP